MRTFLLKRNEDVHGISGTGVVAEGVQFTDGTVVVRWLGSMPTLVVFENIEDVVAIHGHGGRTIVVWLETNTNVEATNTFLTIDLKEKGK